MEIVKSKCFVEGLGYVDSAYYKTSDVNKLSKLEQEIFDCNFDF